MKKPSIAIVGAGNIADNYIKIIKKEKIFNILAITSRTKKKATKLALKYNIKNIYDSTPQMIADHELEGIIILVSADQIFLVTKKLLKYKIPLFIEKPPGLNLNETKILSKLAKKYKTLNMVCLNRRFYSIFKKGIDIIKKKGKILGVKIEGHERFWKVNKKFNKKIIKSWLYANSIHTIDLLRFFGGEVHDCINFSNSIKQKKGDQFCAAFKFKNKSIGSYTSHWFSPGGWSVKLFGEGVTVVFDPLEKGYSIDKNFKKKLIYCDKYDQKYKPGLYRQIMSFKNLIKDKKILYPAQDLSNSIKSMNIVHNLSKSK
jgi:predicted dehydrogenase